MSDLPPNPASATDDLGPTVEETTEISADAEAPATVPEPPADTAPPTALPDEPPSPPAAPAIAVDERAYAQYRQLAEAVLDSADIASRAAEAAVMYARELQQAADDLRSLSEATEKKAKILIAIAGTVMFICLLFFLVMGIRLGGRVGQLDNAIETVGKRVGDLNAGLASLGAVNESVQELASRQNALTEAQSQIGSQIEATLKQSESLAERMPAEAAKKMAQNSEGMARALQGIQGRLQAQASAVQTLGSEVKSLKDSVANVDGLKRDVAALVTLQKERYLETVQKQRGNAAVSPKEQRTLSYPRYQQPKGDNPSAPAQY